MKVSRLIWVISFFVFISGCSGIVLTPAEKVPVPASKAEKQLLEQAGISFKQGDFNSALQALQQVLSLNPDNVEAMYATARSYLLLEKFNKSLEFSKRAATYKNEHLADIYLLTGKTYQLLDDPWNALRSYRFASSVYPKDQRIHYSLGDTYAYLNKPELAAESFKAVIRLNPGHAASHFQLGSLYYINDYLTPALLSLSTALLLEPEQGPAALIRKKIYDLLAREVLTGVNKDEGDFQSVDEVLRRQRVNLLHKTGKETAFNIIKAQYRALFKELDTAKIKNQKKTFVMDSYVTFYNKVYQQGLDETFVYTIFQGSQDTAISNWLENQPDKVKLLGELVKSYRR
jgi:tetratricopeptide (TPR) repeat protein